MQRVADAAVEAPTSDVSGEPGLMRLLQEAHELVPEMSAVLVKQFLCALATIGGFEKSQLAYSGLEQLLQQPLELTADELCDLVWAIAKLRCGLNNATNVLLTAQVAATEPLTDAH